MALATALMGVSALGAAASAAAAQGVTDCRSASDPNLPGPSGPEGLPIRWTYNGNSTVPLVYFNGALASAVGHPAIYLGFDDHGSWLEHPDNGGKLYVWNGATHRLLQQPQLIAYLPPKLMEGWKNQDPNPQYMRMQYRGDLIERLRDSGKVHQPQQSDPNLPCIMGEGPGVAWSYIGTALGVGVPPVASFPPGNTTATYLGYNEQGSWFMENTGVLHVWNLATRTVTTASPPRVQVPADLRNPSFTMRQAVSRGLVGPPGPSRTLMTGRSDSTAAAGGTGAGPPAGRSAGPERGVGARVAKGLLTFTVNDPQSPENGRRKSVRVARPINNPNPAASLGATGSWIGRDGGRVMLFMVQGDLSVTGNPVPAKLLPMLLPAGR